MKFIIAIPGLRHPSPEPAPKSQATEYLSTFNCTALAYLSRLISQVFRAKGYYKHKGRNYE